MDNLFRYIDIRAPLPSADARARSLDRPTEQRQQFADLHADLQPPVQRPAIVFEARRAASRPSEGPLQPPTLAAPPECSEAGASGRPADRSPVACELTAEALLEPLRRREPQAVAAFYSRHNAHVERVLTRVLGLDPEIPDLAQEVFLQAIRSLHQVRGDAGVLKSWLTTIAVYIGRHHIQHKMARRWLQSTPEQEIPERPASTAGPDVVEALGRARRLLERGLPVDERIAFVLRFLNGWELTEVANACEVSLATIKRRLQRARERFERLAAQDAILRGWLPDAR